MEHGPPYYNDAGGATGGPAQRMEQRKLCAWLERGGKALGPPVYCSLGSPNLPRGHGLRTSLHPRAGGSNELMQSRKILVQILELFRP